MISRLNHLLYHFLITIHFHVASFYAIKYRVGQKLGGSDTISACVSLPPNFWPTLYFEKKLTKGICSLNKLLGLN